MNNEEKILAALQTMQTGMADITGRLSGLEASMDRLESRQTRLEASVDKLESGLSSLEVRQCKLESKVDQQKKEIIGEVKVLMESYFTPKFNALAESSAF